MQNHQNVLRSRRPRYQPHFEWENEPVQVPVQANRSHPSLSVSRKVSLLHLPLKTLIYRTILTTFFVFIWKTIQRLMHSKSLLFVGLYPFTGAMYLFLVMPLATCFAFPQDLPSNVNPLKPKDYAFLIKKTWFAMKRNNFKVEGKDL